MKTSHLHFMGIGGQGISAVAQMAQRAGEVVTGCDQQASATTALLEQAGIAVHIGHAPQHLEGVDTLVISPAVPALNAQNPELVAAYERKLRVATWQEMLGELMHGKCVLSVSGVHGKGTTTAMLSLMLVDGGLDPTCEIGAVVPRFGANYRLGKSEYFVNEADEFNHNFWHYHPRLAIVTSIEFEHPEFFVDYEAFLSAFEHFIQGMDTGNAWPIPPTVILNADSPGSLELRTRIEDWPGRVVTYAVETSEDHPGQADFVAHDICLEGETTFRVKALDASIPVERVFSLQLPGIHNIQNALAALVAARMVGVEADSLAKTLKSFGGIRRRFEIRYNGPLAIDQRTVDVVIIDDYAHHPTAIAATLAATRLRYPGRRLVAVYQPHMYSRTKTFFEQFVQSFDDADLALLADIFPARERDTGLVHTRDLVAALAQRPHFQGSGQVIHSGGVEETVYILRETLQDGDIVLVMGAGDIYRVSEKLLAKTVLA